MRNNWMNSLSLNQRLYLPLVFFVVVLFIVFQTLSSYKYIESEKQNLVNRIPILSTGIGTNLTAAIQFDDATTGQEILSAFSADPMIVSVSVLTENNVVFAGFNNTDNRHIPTNDAEEIILKQGDMFLVTSIYICRSLFT